MPVSGQQHVAQTPQVWHEHAVYLRYISAFYDLLPPFSIFIHGHHESWHTRTRGSAARQVAIARVLTLTGTLMIATFRLIQFGTSQ